MITSIETMFEMITPLIVHMLPAIAGSVFGLATLFFVYKIVRNVFL